MPVRRRSASPTAPASPSAPFNTTSPPRPTPGGGARAFVREPVGEVRGHLRRRCIPRGAGGNLRRPRLAPLRQRGPSVDTGDPLEHPKPFSGTAVRPGAGFRSARVRGAPRACGTPSLRTSISPRGASARFASSRSPRSLGWRSRPASSPPATECARRSTCSRPRSSRSSSGRWQKPTLAGRRAAARGKLSLPNG